MQRHTLPFLMNAAPASPNQLLFRSRSAPPYRGRVIYRLGAAAPQPSSTESSHSPGKLQLDMMVGCIRLCALETSASCTGVWLYHGQHGIDAPAQNEKDGLVHTVAPEWTCALEVEPRMGACANNNSGSNNNNSTDGRTAGGTAATAGSSNNLGNAAISMGNEDAYTGANPNSDSGSTLLWALGAACFPISLHASSPPSLSTTQPRHHWFRLTQTAWLSPPPAVAPPLHCPKHVRDPAATVSGSRIIINDVDMWRCNYPEEVAMYYTVDDGSGAGSNSIARIAYDTQGRMPMIMPKAAIVARIRDAAVSVPGYGAITVTVAAAGVDDAMHNNKKSNRSYIFGKWYHDAGAVANAEREACPQLGGAATRKRHAHGPPSAIAMRTIRMPSPLLNLVLPFSEFYQHTVFDVLPRLALALPILSADPTIKVLHSGPHAKLLIAFAGIDGLALRMIAATPCTSYASDVVVYMPQIVGNNAKMGVVPPGILIEGRKRLARGHHGNHANHDGGMQQQPAPKTSGKTVLYLRRPFGKRRALTQENEAALLDAVKAGLATTGGRLQIFENGSDWQTDQHLFASAAAVFGPHGGAFANILFLPAGAHVVEFVASSGGVGGGGGAGNERPCYQGLALACGLHYWGLEPTSGFHFTDKREQMTVNPDAVLDIMAKLGLVVNV